MIQSPTKCPPWTDAGIPMLRDIAWEIWYVKDNAARKWYYETQIRPIFKREET